MSLQRQVMAKVGCRRRVVGQGRVSALTVLLNFLFPLSLFFLFFLSFPSKLRSSSFSPPCLLPLSTSLYLHTTLPNPSPPFLLLTLLVSPFPFTALLSSPLPVLPCKPKNIHFYDGFGQKRSSLCESDCEDGNSDATPRPSSAVMRALEVDARTLIQNRPEKGYGKDSICHSIHKFAANLYLHLMVLVSKNDTYVYLDY